jgi:hypothetical protein
VKNKFLDRYFPLQKKKEVPQTKNPAPSALQRIRGQISLDYYCHACLLNTSYLPPNTTYPLPTAFEVKVTDDGMLSVVGTTWKQIEPMLFVRVDGETAGRSLLGFKKNSKGEIAYMFQDSSACLKRMRLNMRRRVRQEGSCHGDNRRRSKQRPKTAFQRLGRPKFKITSI